MDFILCSAAFVICLAVQVSSVLPPKPIGEWHPDRYEMYPNPWVNSSACQTTETSGLCDINGILNDTERKDLIEHPEMKKVSDADRCLCNKDCTQIEIKVTVAIMKKIGPQISDYRAGAKEFAEKFRLAWNLANCSVILIASNGDNMCYLDAGSDVINLLPAGMTEQIDRDINNSSCSKGLFVKGINETLNEYRNALATAAQTSPPTTPPTTSPTPEPSTPKPSTPIIVGVIVGVVVVAIILTTIICIRYKKKAHRSQAKEAKDIQPLKSEPKVKDQIA